MWKITQILSSPSYRANRADIISRARAKYSLQHQSLTRLASKVAIYKTIETNRTDEFLDPLFVDNCHDLIFPTKLTVSYWCKQNRKFRYISLTEEQEVALFNHSLETRIQMYKSYLRRDTCLISLPYVKDVLFYFRILIGLQIEDIRASDINFVDFIRFMEIFLVTDEYFTFLFFNLQVSIHTNKSFLPALYILAEEGTMPTLRKLLLTKLPVLGKSLRYPASFRSYSAYMRYYKFVHRNMSKFDNDTLPYNQTQCTILDICLESQCDKILNCSICDSWRFQLAIHFYWHYSKILEIHNDLIFFPDYETSTKFRHSKDNHIIEMPLVEIQSEELIIETAIKRKHVYFPSHVQYCANNITLINPCTVKSDHNSLFPHPCFNSYIALHPYKQMSRWCYNRDYNIETYISPKFYRLTNKVKNHFSSNPRSIFPFPVDILTEVQEELIKSHQVLPALETLCLLFFKNLQPTKLKI